jgi:hypothetical protein
MPQREEGAFGGANVEYGLDRDTVDLKQFKSSQNVGTLKFHATSG